MIVFQSDKLALASIWYVTLSQVTAEVAYFVYKLWAII